MKRLCLLLPAVLIMAACSKNNKTSITPQPTEPKPVILDSSATGSPVTVTVNQDQAGYEIANDFVGLSFETDILLYDPRLLHPNNTTMLQLIGNLGPGVLRIGGDSSDFLYWLTAPTTDSKLLSTTHVDNLAAFSKATGWPLIFGLNLGKFNQAKAVSLATYLDKSMGSQLHALQIGNEPNIFDKIGFRESFYTSEKYHSEWASYFAAVKTAIPHATFAGPDVEKGSDWVNSFAATHGKNIDYLTCHYYNNGPNTNPAITYKTILEPDTKAIDYLNKVRQSAAQHNLPYRVSECNSIFDGGGKTGVSDVFASTLWALDFMWIVAENNGRGVNFHGGASQAFSPVQFVKGVTTPRPLYYGMLAFKQGANMGNTVPVTSGQSAINHSAHASIKNDSTFVTLINKDETDLLYTVKLKKTVNKVNIIRLKAPGLTSPNGITLGGSAVQKNGSFAVNKDSVKRYTVNQKAFVIHVPASSAAILQID